MFCEFDEKKSMGEGERGETRRELTSFLFGLFALRRFLSERKSFQKLGAALGRSS